jgi:uncharacterized protein YodC (DUF2158 family)
MTVIKSGDLVVLKSGGPTMTVDTVNTDIFDDNKITGVLCVWFVGDKLERVRFDHRAIEPAVAQKTAPKKKNVRPEKVTGEYKTVLDEMVAAMNIPAKAEQGGSIRRAKPGGSGQARGSVEAHGSDQARRVRGRTGNGHRSRRLTFPEAGSSPAAIRRLSGGCAARLLQMLTRGLRGPG